MSEDAHDFAKDAQLIYDAHFTANGDMPIKLASLVTLPPTSHQQLAGSADATLRC